MPSNLFRILLLAVVAFGAWLRFAGLGRPSLWLDEMLHVYRATETLAQPWYAWLTGFSFEVENGSLFYASQLLARAVAEGEVAVRLAPALWGTLAVAVIGLAGRALGGPWTGFAAALLLALSPYHVYYSREGRVYALIMLFSCLLLWVFLRRPSARNALLGFAVCLGAAYVGAVAGPLLGAAAGCAGLLVLMAVWRIRDRPLGKWLREASVRHEALLLAAAAAAVVLVALLYLGAPRYTPEPGEERGTTPKVTDALSRAALERTASALAHSGLDSARLESRAAWFLGFAFFGILATLRRNPRAGVVAASLFVATLVASFVTLYYLNQWFLVRYLAAAVPPFVLLLAAGVAELARLIGSLLRRVIPESAGRFAEGTVAVVLLAALGLPNLAAARSEPYKKADWRHAARLLEDLALPGEQVIASNEWSKICLKHYLGDSPKGLTVEDAGQKTPNAKKMAAAAKSAWLITAGYHGRTDIRGWFRSHHPIWTTPIEGLGLYFYPGFRKFVTSRSGRPCEHCTEAFERLGSKLDFDGRGALFQGKDWFPAEKMPDGLTFQWIDGDRADLALPVPDGDRDYTIRLHAMPLTYDSAPPQQLVVRVGGRPAGTIDVLPGWNVYELDVPRRFWQHGLNLLILKLSWAARPLEVVDGSDDPRQLGLAVDYLELVR